MLVVVLCINTGNIRSTNFRSASMGFVSSRGYVSFLQVRQVAKALVSNGMPLSIKLMTGSLLMLPVSHELQQ